MLAVLNANATYRMYHNHLSIIVESITQINTYIADNQLPEKVKMYQPLG